MSFHKKKSHGGEENLDAWLMTYADMITLVLCFFIILLSVSEPKKERFEMMKEGIMSKFSTLAVETPFDSVVQATKGIVEAHEAEREVAVSDDEESMQIELSSSSFFEPGSATIKPEKQELLAKIADEITHMKFDDYTAEVEGHTDNVPISNERFPSNWELSAGRASAVVRFLIEHKLDAKRMKATAYADVRPKVANLDKSGKPIPENQEQNRRVVIRLVRTK